MTPQKKAKELVQKYLCKIIEFAYAETHYKELAKQCALIAAENIRTEMVQAQNYERAIYWRDVKSQIKKL